jgi:hypothetical protein
MNPLLVKCPCLLLRNVMVPDESVWPRVLNGDVLWAAYHRLVCVESERFPPVTFLGDSVAGRWSSLARAPTT